MERTKVNTPEPQLVKFKKLGGGSLRLGNRIIKPGQIFEEDPKNIPPAWKKFVLPLSGAEVETWSASIKSPNQAPVIEGKKPTYKLAPHGKSLYLFDIVDEQGKVLNEKSLKKEVAEKLIEDLQR